MILYNLIILHSPDSIAQQALIDFSIGSKVQLLISHEKTDV